MHNTYSVSWPNQLMQQKCKTKSVYEFHHPFYILNNIRQIQNDYHETALNTNITAQNPYSNYYFLILINKAMNRMPWVFPWYHQTWENYARGKACTQSTPSQLPFLDIIWKNLFYISISQNPPRNLICFKSCILNVSLSRPKQLSTNTQSQTPK